MRLCVCVCVCLYVCAWVCGCGCVGVWVCVGGGGCGCAKHCRVVSVWVFVRGHDSIFNQEVSARWLVHVMYLSNLGERDN